MLVIDPTDQALRVADDRTRGVDMLYLSLAMRRPSRMAQASANSGSVDGTLSAAICSTHPCELLQIAAAHAELEPTPASTLTIHLWGEGANLAMWKMVAAFRRAPSGRFRDDKAMAMLPRQRTGFFSKIHLHLLFRTHHMSMEPNTNIPELSLLEFSHRSLTVTMPSPLTIW